MTRADHDLHNEGGAMPFRPALPLLRSRALLRVSGRAGIAIAAFNAIYFGLQLLRGVL